MIIIVILFVAGIIAMIVFGILAEKKRREEMTALAARLGLNFSSDHNTQIASRFGFLDKLAQGSNRYAYNMLSGKFGGGEVLVFDYHYETHSTDSKGRRQTHHHYFSFFIMMLPVSFPELRIYKEDLFSKIGQAMGYADIDFESREFSSAFCVRSPDKKFAYDVCNAQMMEYLLVNRDLNVEIERDALALAFDRKLKAVEIEANLGRLNRVRSLMPNYLFEGRPA